MAYTEKKLQYNLKYKKENMKRIPFDLRYTGEGLTYELLKSAAEAKGEPVNTFIKNACIERIERMMKGEKASNDK